jgi:hypothetical protein
MFLRRSPGWRRRLRSPSRVDDDLGYGVAEAVPVEDAEQPVDEDDGVISARQVVPRDGSQASERSRVKRVVTSITDQPLAFRKARNTLITL